jgi:hypothetical protein
VRLVARRGVRVLSSGYIDAPPIPNIAFSIREFKQAMGWATPSTDDAQPAADAAAVWRRMQALTHFESHPLAVPFRPIIAHHIYALGAAE